MPASETKHCFLPSLSCESHTTLESHESKAGTSRGSVEDWRAMEPCLPYPWPRNSRRGPLAGRGAWVGLRLRGPSLLGLSDAAPLRCVSRVQGHRWRMPPRDRTVDQVDALKSGIVVSIVATCSGAIFNSTRTSPAW